MRDIDRQEEEEKQEARRGKREMRDKRGKSRREQAASGGTFKGCTCHIAAGGMAPVDSG